ncbi:YncE family protein [Acidipila sp. EB88]|uniref:YncE family protein n=1 Tax=Acidipila sp. EB88 TaxID=2305226 RepID=UPI001F3CF495|nr:YncE family protein [Acidipila sp. EB88]
MLLAVPQIRAQAAAHPVLLALSKSDHTLAIVDPATLKVITRMPVGPDPHEVIASADGKRAWVSNMLNSQGHELDVLDLMNHKALPSIDTAPMLGLHGLDFQGGKVWFTAQGAKAIGRLDPATGRTEWIMGTGQDFTHLIRVKPDGQTIFVSNAHSASVSILENRVVPPNPMHPGPPGPPQRDWTVTTIPTSWGTEGFDVSPDWKELWTAAASDGKLWIIDTAHRRVAASIDAKLNGANRLKFTPDGKRVLISILSTGDLFVYDVASRKQVKRVSLGKGCAGILLDPDGSRAFVGCTAANYVAVVDLKTLTVTSHLDVGGGPDGLTWAKRP